MPTLPPKDTPSMTRGFLSIEHAAQWSDVSIKTVRRWISKGLPRYQAGPHSKVLIRPGDIESFLTRQQTPKPVLDVMVEEVMGELQRGKGVKDMAANVLVERRGLPHPPRTAC